MNAKYDAIESKIVGSEDKQVQLMTKRTEVREIDRRAKRRLPVARVVDSRKFSKDADKYLLAFC